MVQIPAKALTLSEFLDLPETEPASEYIDGHIIQKPMPQGEHSAIQTELAPAINLVVKPKQIARAFCKLRCTFGVGVARRIVQLCLTFLCLRGIEFPVKKMVGLLTFFQLPQIGQLKFYLPIKVKLKLPRIFCIA